jgi:succinate dehydrogenase / fumarate reductase, cytochrome b subunit
MADIANVFGRHEFVVRRLHSLLGLVPVGAFLCVHFATNFSILDGAKTFQARVNQIHDIGPVTLFFVEWVFIFLPILFHGLVGAIIVLRGKRDVLLYPYRENIRYTLQRWTGVIALAFILWHVFHTRGWMSGEWWLEHVTRPLGGGTFNANDAAATAATAIRASLVVQIAYVVGVLASVFHFANGLWTMGITWGVWTSPRAQRWANWPCLAVGLALAVMGFGALVGMYAVAIR